MNGRLDEAESLVVRAAELGSRVPGSPSPLVSGAQVFILRWLQGRLRELEPVMGALVEQIRLLPRGAVRSRSSSRRSASFRAPACASTS